MIGIMEIKSRGVGLFRICMWVWVSMEFYFGVFGWICRSFR